MTTNSAYRIHGYGGPEVMTLDEIDRPDVQPGQYLVQVKAVGINPIDWRVRTGLMSAISPLTFPAILGAELAGEIVDAGAGATRFAVGDRVAAYLGGNGGAFADMVLVEEGKLALIPAALSDVAAAAIPVASATAWQALHAAGELRSGMNVLIHGAAGNVGGFAVQFAKAAGASVIGTALAANRNYVLGLGASSVIDYATQRFESIVDNIDLVLDTVGGDTLDRSWSILASNGAIVSIADPLGIMTRAPIGSRGFFNSTKPDAPRLAETLNAVADGGLHSSIAKVFSKHQLSEAIEFIQTSYGPGKVVVDFFR